MGDHPDELEKQKEAEEQDQPEKKKEETVRTPAGPMRKEQTHKVGPGQVIRRNPDGTYSVVPKD